MLVSVSIDYSAFALAYGGSFAQRLQLVADPGVRRADTDRTGVHGPPTVASVQRPRRPAARVDDARGRRPARHDIRRSHHRDHFDIDNLCDVCDAELNDDIFDGGAEHDVDSIGNRRDLDDGVTEDTDLAGGVGFDDATDDVACGHVVCGLVAELHVDFGVVLVVVGAGCGGAGGRAAGAVGGVVVVGRSGQ